MEIAVFISKVENLKYVNQNYSRLYFGNEFCENLIVSCKDLKQVLDFVERKNLDFTFVTPFVSNKGIEKLKQLLELIADRKPDSEVVINDWGILHLVNTDFNFSKLILGRLLNKLKRDPRIMVCIKKIPPSILDYLQKSNITTSIFQKLLQSNRIGRIEFDNILQGINLNTHHFNIKLEGSLYYPYVYVTTTRLCPTNACDQIDKPIPIISSCNRECQNYEFHFKHNSMPKILILKGNTYFYKNEDIEDNLKNALISRIVYQPEIPI